MNRDADVPMRPKLKVRGATDNTFFDVANVLGIVLLCFEACRVDIW